MVFSNPFVRGDADLLAQNKARWVRASEYGASVQSCEARELQFQCDGGAGRDVLKGREVLQAHSLLRKREKGAYDLGKTW